MGLRVWYCSLECSPSSTKYWLWTHCLFSFFFHSFLILCSPRCPVLYGTTSCLHLCLTSLLSFFSYAFCGNSSFSHRTDDLFTFSTTCSSSLPVFSGDRLTVSSSLQRGKAASPSRLQLPIESCWAPISLLIGWAGLSRYWKEELL